MLSLSKSQREALKQEFAPVPNDPTETTKRVIAWCQFFFGDPENEPHTYLRVPGTPAVHWGIHYSLSVNYKFYYCTSPREFAKSTCLRLNTLYRIYYKTEPYILLIGKVGDSGKAMLADIKFDIEFNPKLLEVYGELRPLSREAVWSAHEIAPTNGVYLRSIGMMGSVRSGQKKGWRYTLIIGDDVQASPEMQEPSTLETHKSFWEREIEFSIDSTYGKVRYIGNLLGPGCLLDHIMKDSKYQGTSFHSLVDENGKPDMLDNPKEVKGISTWEAYHPTKKLRDEAKKAIEEGKRPIFLAERQNLIVAELTKELTGWKYHHMTFKRFQGVQNILISDEYPDPIPVYTFLYVDPAFADGDNADERVLMTVARGRIFIRIENIGEPIAFNMTWILEYDYNFMSPTKIIDRSLELHKKYFFSSVIIEAIGGAQIYQPMMNEKVVGDGFFSKYPFTPIFVKYQPADKKGRIYTGLNPRLSLGQIAIRPEMKEIETEGKLFNSLKSPHLSDTLETGERNSHVCTETLYRELSKLEKYRIERDEPDDGILGYVPQTLDALDIFGIY